MTDPNDSAFPYIPEYHESGDRLDEIGLTKREYFSALAMQAVINLGFKADGNADPEFTAKDAIKYADALIIALNKEQPR